MLRFIGETLFLLWVFGTGMGCGLYLFDEQPNGRMLAATMAIGGIGGGWVGLGSFARLFIKRGQNTQ